MKAKRRPNRRLFLLTRHSRCGIIIIDVYYEEEYLMSNAESHKSASVPSVPNWNTDNKYNYEDTFLDYGEFDNLNKSLVDIGLSLKNINKKLAMYEKQKAELDVQYKRNYRKAFLETVVKTESHRKIYAEVACEDLEIKIMYLDQIIKELTRISFSLRTELEIVQTIGHNIRREMTI